MEATKFDPKIIDACANVRTETARIIGIIRATADDPTRMLHVREVARARCSKLEAMLQLALVTAGMVISAEHVERSLGLLKMHEELAEQSVMALKHVASKEGN